MHEQCPTGFPSLLAFVAAGAASAQAVAKSDGPDGAWSKVSSVQRVNTAGGAAPATGCAEATAGTTSRVSYTADYRMYVPK